MRRELSVRCASTSYFGLPWIRRDAWDALGLPFLSSSSSSSRLQPIDPLPPLNPLLRSSTPPPTRFPPPYPPSLMPPRYLLRPPLSIYPKPDYMDWPPSTSDSVASSLKKTCQLEPPLFPASLAAARPHVLPVRSIFRVVIVPRGRSACACAPRPLNLTRCCEDAADLVFSSL